MNHTKLLNHAILSIKSSIKVFENSDRNNIVKNEGKDIKLETDIKLNDIIYAKLMETGIPIISEENKNEIKNLTTLSWIVDPLDGTMNYFRNFSKYCISIALWDNKDPIFGVIYDLNTGAYYYSQNQQSFKDSELIMVSNVKSIKDSIISTGFPSKMNFSNESINQIVKSVKEFKKVRAIGSAALSLCHVAEGVFDIYYEDDINIWDVAAGIPIVLNSGGKVYYKLKNESFKMEVLASNAEIFSKSKKIFSI